MPTHPCPLCGGDAEQERQGPDDVGRIFRKYHCQNHCRRFWIQADFEWNIRAARGDATLVERIDVPSRIRRIAREDLGSIYPNLHLLSGWSRQAVLENRSPPWFDDETAALHIRLAPKRVPERIDRLLLNLELLAGKDASTVVRFSTQDYPLGYCSSVPEFHYFLEHLRTEGLIRDYVTDELKIAVAGWERLAEIHQYSPQSSQIFVAMSFADEHEYIFDEGLAPAIESLGYTPRIMRDHEHAEIIDVEMLLEIQRSRCLVAEMTGVNAGAYFETGYAVGRNIPVLFTCLESEIGAQHFDTNHYSYTLWNDTEDLGKKLAKRIEFVVGRVD